MKFLKDYFLLIAMLLCGVLVVVLSMRIAPVPVQDTAALQTEFDQKNLAEGGAVNVPTPLEGKVVEDYNKPQSLPKQDVTIIKANGEKVVIQSEIAKSGRETSIGMMFRDSVPEKTGMLFLFDELEEHVFWMKNTFVPLDIIFVGEDKKVIHIHKMAKPMVLDPIPSKGKVFAVLEIAGGQADSFGLAVGDQLVNADLELYYQKALELQAKEAKELPDVQQ